MRLLAFLFVMSWAMTRSKILSSQGLIYVLQAKQLITGIGSILRRQVIDLLVQPILLILKSMAQSQVW